MILKRSGLLALEFLRWKIVKLFLVQSACDIIINEMILQSIFSLTAEMAQYFYQMTEQQKKINEESSERIEKILLQLNKTGLSYLKCMKYAQAIQFFKKAEKILASEMQIDTQNQKINQLAGVTYNNLACYYKKTKKPKVALSYLKKSLELQVYKISNWVSTGSTHLNICAILSYLNKHEQALNHANLSINLLQKSNFELNDESQEGKSYWNIKMLSYYNKAIEEEHLKMSQLAIQSYKAAKEIAKKSGSKNIGIIVSCDEAITRNELIVNTMKKRMLNIILKRKQDYEAGHYDAMKNNKKYSLRKDDRHIYLDDKKRFSLYKPQPYKSPTKKNISVDVLEKEKAKRQTFNKQGPENMREYLSGNKQNTEPTPALNDNNL